MANFEVLMVSVEWESPDKIRNIIPAKRALKPSKTSDNKYDYDIVLYHTEDHSYFQLAIKTQFKPYFKDNQGIWNELYQAIDDIWIIKGEWKTRSNGSGYHYCHSINTAGKIQLAFRYELKKVIYISVDVNINIDDFDFEQLKDDFEGQLWSLITSNKSIVKTDKVEFKYGNRLIRFPENKLIIDFIKTYELISKNPKTELSLLKTYIKNDKVIPIAETYRKISTSGITKTLPSKSAAENFDIYENRLICSFLYRIYYILIHNSKTILRQIDKLKRELKVLNEKIVILEDPEPIVNIDEIENEIKFQKEKVRQLKNKWELVNNLLFTGTVAEYETLVITLRKPNHHNSFWCSSSISDWCIIEFPSNIMQYLFCDKSYRMVVIYSQKNFYKARSGIEYPVYYINQISQIEPQELIDEKKILDKQEINLKTFEENEFRQKSIMNDQEMRKFEFERIEQINTLKRKVSQIQSKINVLQEFDIEQNTLIPIIEQHIKSKFFIKVKWRTIIGFKPSMTFIQNSKYRNALRYYNEILISEGIDFEIFDLYENVTSYGVREMPLIYELWCLITLLTVLEENFNFIPEKEDLNQLFKSIDPNKQKIENYVQFRFKQKFAGREIILHYQKNLNDGKRPDFILEIIHGERKIYLILDSKFKNYNYKQTIIYESLAMYEKYGNNPDCYVFVLHPCKDGFFENRRIKYTNYGGERIYYNLDNENKQVFPFHNFGFVELQPNATDAIKKLIGMGLQYLIETNRTAKIGNLTDPKPEFPLFCISCGSDDITIQAEKRGDNRSYYLCKCNNSNCGLSTYIDYCWNCKTKLFKHGSFWDYHLESIWSVVDIHCPNCGMTMADRAK